MRTIACPTYANDPVIQDSAQWLDSELSCLCRLARRAFEAHRSHLATLFRDIHIVDACRLLDNIAPV